MRIAFAVSMVPEREAALRELLSQLSPRNRPRVYLDTEHTGGSWSNYRRALLDAESRDCDWLVSMDDDVLLCDDFECAVARALAQCTGDFATCYLSNRIVTERALERGATWIATRRVVHGLCWAVRPAVAREVVEVAERHVRPEYYSGDQRLQAWLVKTGRTNLVALPNLVQHRADMESEIAQGARNCIRQSPSFARDLSAETWVGPTHIDTVSPERALRVLASRGALRGVAAHEAEALRVEAAKKLRTRLYAEASRLTGVRIEP